MTDAAGTRPAAASTVYQGAPADDDIDDEMSIDDTGVDQNACTEADMAVACRQLEPCQHCLRTTQCCEQVLALVDLLESAQLPSAYAADEHVVPTLGRADASRTARRHGAPTPRSV
eukprot:CAMPEP_0185553388 /NCGR_PEP_ID=MMETSP1381-20130426/37705_1 /TAXON_ID=298111 /ORGANISM="Pavlova sp., Strain CCMP459" /LENGTH=115 /DNA_ID=CAMNT_0028166495 /DNA_START=231 /DNA_END=574 /DNA_ORIENTATION=+